MTIDETWDYLVETGTFTEEELQLVTDLNGYSFNTIDDAIYARTGYRNIEQLMAENGD